MEQDACPFHITVLWFPLLEIENKSNIYSLLKTRLIVLASPACTVLPDTTCFVSMISSGPPIHPGQKCHPCEESETQRSCLFSRDHTASQWWHRLSARSALSPKAGCFPLCEMQRPFKGRITPSCTITVFGCSKSLQPSQTVLHFPILELNLFPL